MLVPKRRLALVFASSLLLVVSGCATLFTPGMQAIPVASVPEGAEVFIDGELVGTTPLTVELRTNLEHEVMIRFGTDVRTWTLVRQVGGAGIGGFVGDGVVLAGGVGVSLVGLLLAEGLSQGQADPTAGILLVVGVSAVPLVIDLAINDYYELVPREIEAEFE